MVDNEAIVTYNLCSHPMALPESLPEQAPQPPVLGREIQLSRPEVARTLAFVQSQYDFQRYLSPDVEIGLNLPTVLAAMHAIDAKGQEKGWEYKDLLAALPVTRAALTTVGFDHAQNGLHALLTGTTGDLEHIVGKILPPDAPKGIKWTVKAMILANTVDNMRVVIGLLIDEKIMERRLLRLTKLQQHILLDPGKSRALLDLLNGDYTVVKTFGRTGLPQEAETHLEKICPFSLEDMSVVSNLFTAVEWRRNSAIQVEAQRLKIQTGLARLDAAGTNLGRIAAQGFAEVVKAGLFVVGGTIGGVIGGLYVAGDEGVDLVRRAGRTVKRKNEERKAA